MSFHEGSKWQEEIEDARAKKEASERNKPFEMRHENRRRSEERPAPNADFDAIIQVIRESAAAKRESAAMSGSLDDGGADRLLQQIEFFNHGRQGTLPPAWERYVSEVTKKREPEKYAEYLRLKKLLGE
jgi:hypothetical protein